MTRKPEDYEGHVRIATSDEDRPELERLRKGIIKALKKFGVYEPALDDILVEHIASSTIYWKKMERFLDSASADEYTFVRITDSKLKMQKMIEDAMRELAVSRRERLNRKDSADLRGSSPKP